MLRKVVKWSFLLVFFYSLTVRASGRTVETSLLTIKAYTCTKSKGKILGVVDTGNDLGGANYKLRFEGAIKEVQSFCDVLAVLKKKSDYVSLRISGSKQLPDSSTYTGHLNAIVVQPPTD